MSLRERSLAATDLSFPRVSGDEPLVLIARSGTSRFSPRERG